MVTEWNLVLSDQSSENGVNIQQETVSASAVRANLVSDMNCPLYLALRAQYHSSRADQQGTVATVITQSMLLNQNNPTC
jgi:hypothetical protein